MINCLTIQCNIFSIQLQSKKQVMDMILNNKTKILHPHQPLNIQSSPTTPHPITTVSHPQSPKSHHQPHPNNHATTAQNSCQHNNSTQRPPIPIPTPPISIQSLITPNYS